MGKTRRADEDKQSELIQELKGKLKAQKKEITRLNRRIKSLENRIDDKVKKRVAKKKLDPKHELIEQLRKDFMKCK